MSKQQIVYKYTFVFTEEKKIEFVLTFDSENFNLQTQNVESYPEWTYLSYHKCHICPLNETETKYCPTAVSLVPLINTFSSFTSYENVELRVETPQRIYIKNTTVQKGLSSLIGLYMTTTNCPILSKLKPLARFHLPVATAEETFFRVVSMFLIQQYLLLQQGKTPDWTLKDLTNLYEDIKIVNKSFCDRISSVIEKDASVNALIILNCFAEWIYLTIKKPNLKQIEKLINL